MRGEADESVAHSDGNAFLGHFFFQRGFVDPDGKGNDAGAFFGHGRAHLFPFALFHPVDDAVAELQYPLLDILHPHFQ